MVCYLSGSIRSFTHFGNLLANRTFDHDEKKLSHQKLERRFVGARLGWPNIDV